MKQLTKRERRGREFWIREDAIDTHATDYYIEAGYHMPLGNLPENAVILDLGAFNGATAVDFGLAYPHGKVYAYEMDEDNATLAGMNTAGLNNVVIVNAAVWEESGVAYYRQASREDGYQIAQVLNEDDPCRREVPVWSISDIMERHGLGWVDYIKMDIEGAEREIFNGNLDWLNRVGEINVEFHGDEARAAVLAGLSRVGWSATISTHHWAAIIGRPQGK